MDSTQVSRLLDIVQAGLLAYVLAGGLVLLVIVLAIMFRVWRTTR